MNSATIIAGTRPELVKMAPIVQSLERRRTPFSFINTGQHYDQELSGSFIKDLGYPKPEYELNDRANNPADLTGQIIMGVAAALRQLTPSLVLVQGDTNTTLAATIAALKEGIPVGHVESGLRSYDWRMPEEHNRRMVDHSSNYLFAPTETALRNVVAEKAPGIKRLTGNTVIDAIMRNLPIAEANSLILEQLRFSEFILATAHRAENVDDPNVLKEFVGAFLDSPLPIVFPVHPRTVERLKRAGLLDKLLESQNIQLLPPVGYYDLLVLMKNCSLVLTDSGGLQEEATAPEIRKRVVVMRTSTERPEAVDSGFAELAGTRRDNILRCVNEGLDNPERLPSMSPFGDGLAGSRITSYVADILESAGQLSPIPILGIS